MNRSTKCQVTLLTPAGRGAVATVGIYGAAAAEVVGRHFQPSAGGSFAAAALRRIVFGRWQSETESDEAAAEEVVACRLSPGQVEIHCHGGRAAARRIIDSLQGDGCERRSADDRLRHTDEGAIESEARHSLTRAPTRRTAAILLDQLGGALRGALENIIAEIEQGTPELAAVALRELADTSEFGRHLTQPWRVVLAGLPNVGKSTLINTLVGFERAIIHHTPGTTRDLVTATAALDGWPVELTDTAGLRPAEHPVETAGVQRARQAIDSADVVLLLTDRSRPWLDEEQALWEELPGALIVHAKSDLPARSDPRRPAGVAVSAQADAGVEELIEHIVVRLVPVLPPSGSGVLFTDGQVLAIQQAAEQLAAGDASTSAASLKILL